MEPERGERQIDIFTYPPYAQSANKFTAVVVQAHDRVVALRVRCNFGDRSGLRRADRRSLGCRLWRFSPVTE
jgi:hypothetical protein